MILVYTVIQLFYTTLDGSIIYIDHDLSINLTKIGDEMTDLVISMFETMVAILRGII